MKHAEEITILMYWCKALEPVLILGANAPPFPSSSLDISIFTVLTFSACKNLNYVDTIARRTDGANSIFCAVTSVLNSTPFDALAERGENETEGDFLNNLIFRTNGPISHNLEKSTPE